MLLPLAHQPHSPPPPSSSSLSAGSLTNIPKANGLGVLLPCEDLRNLLVQLDLARVIQRDARAGLVFEEGLDVEAQELAGGIGADEVAAVEEGGVELQRVAGLGDQGPGGDGDDGEAAGDLGGWAQGEGGSEDGLEGVEG